MPPALLRLMIPQPGSPAPGAARKVGVVIAGHLYVADPGTPTSPPPGRNPEWTLAGPVDALTDEHTLGRLHTAFWAAVLARGEDDSDARE